MYKRTVLFVPGIINLRAISELIAKLVSTLRQPDTEKTNPVTVHPTTVAAIDQLLLAQVRSTYNSSQAYLEQPEIHAYGWVDWLQQVFIVLFRVVNVATDSMAGHLGGRKWYKQVFQVCRSRSLVQPQVV